MATYAMICNNRVIDVLYNQEVEPKWPPVSDGATVIAAECSEKATRDWGYNPETGEVYEPIPIEPEEPTAPEPTQMDRIEEMLNALTFGTISADSISKAIAEGVNEV